jgi:single-stranded-DNA-specific exonuclease
LAHPAWHAGIVGIVASRLAEQFHKPTVLILNPPGEAARGSARSVPGVDIGNAIAGCRHLLLSYGGHPGAAGLSLLPENIDRFRVELDRQIELNRAAETPPGRIVDAELSWSVLDIALAEQVQRLGPFGNGNPTPQFLTCGLIVDEDRRLGREGDHRRLLLSRNGVQLPVLWFNSRDAELPGGPLDLVYTLGINTFRGDRALQINYVASRATQAIDVLTRTETAPTRVLHDLRRADLATTKLPTPIDAVWYAEGTRLDTAEFAVAYAPRYAAAARGQGDLVIYSAPPSAELLRWLLATVRPAAVYVVAKLTGDDSLDGVLRGIASMCKYALGRDGRLALDRMAARLGTTEVVLRHGLLWLESRGQITILDWSADDGVLIEAGGTPRAGDEVALLQAHLDELLAETRAYRRYFRRAPLPELGLESS